MLALDGAWGGSLPAVFGHEAAGIVEEVGPGVGRVRPGDHVVVTLVRHCGTCHACAQGEPPLCESHFPLDEQSPLTSSGGEPIRQGIRTGAFAEHVVVDASQAVPIPRAVPLDQASLLACGVITGLGAVLNVAAVRPGSRVVTIGTGGVGLNCVQGAALCGAATNIAVDLSDEKLAAARTFGADQTVNPMREDARESVLSMTGGRGADYVFVAAGSARAMEQGATLLRRGGTLVIVGMTAEGVKVQFEAVDIADNALRIIGSKMGSVRPQVDVPMLAEWYLAGRLKLDELISRRYPLGEINTALDDVRAGAALRNVITF
ncbi:zinc-binding dehydrogenase [Geminicoccus flavidas]|uniref:zinc-binding dehydrogenase n=1 Tax=Geminicoccus flavidas TaxID=2506407 RepID=UPI001F221E91|nr:zinc-binding dehydrogenase [Geminicoccus flavidas]